jgi:hypothetical protein
MKEGREKKAEKIIFFFLTRFRPIRPVPRLHIGRGKKIRVVLVLN